MAIHFRFLLSLLTLTAILVAQSPPPEQEEVLRANVQKFYQAMQDGKYRGAYALVADDSQETFMEMAKPKFSEWKIDKIEWSDEFRKATVTLNVATELFIAGQRVPVHRPIMSQWRLEDSEWLWYYVAPKTVRTPFGNVGVNQEASKNKVSVKDKLAEGPSVADISKGLEIITPQPITFRKKEKGEAIIQVKNGLQGHVKVEIQFPKTPGLTVNQHVLNLKANEESVFKLIWTPLEGEDKKARQDLQGIIASFPIGGSKSFILKWID